MDNVDGSVTEFSNGLQTENLLFTYSEEEKEKNEINDSTAQKVFSPEFIPYYPAVQKTFGLTQAETLLYGFIRFYMANGTGKFYFTDEQLSVVLDCNTQTIMRSIKTLKEKDLLIVGHKMKAGGGKIRFINNIRIPQIVTIRRLQNVTLERLQNVTNNNNKIKDNKIKDIIPKGITAKAGNPDINEIISYLEEKRTKTLDGTIKDNRNFAHLLINKIKKDYPDKEPVKAIKALIDIGLLDEFHSKNLTNIRYLYYNTQKLISSYQSNRMTIAVI